MPTYLKSFIIVSVIALGVFSILKRTACSLDDCTDFKRRRNLWFTITATAFLANNYWIYALVATTVILFFLKREKHNVSLFILLLYAIPPMGKMIPGFGITENLFELSHILILSLLLIVPTFLSLSKGDARGANLNSQNQKHAVDFIIFSYILLGALLHARDSSITNVLRFGFYGIVGGFLPYFVISRTLKSQQDFRRVFFYFVVSVAIMSVIAIFEHNFHWLLYPSMKNALGIETNLFKWTLRSGVLRAVASTGHSIALGYLIVIAIGSMLYLRTQFSSRAITYLMFIMLFAGSYFTLSRGPWLGLIILFIFFVLTGPKVITNSIKWGLLASLAITVLSATPWAQKFIDLLPYFGTVDSENITYRQLLIDNSIIIIKKNIWLGSSSYLETPEMQAMIQGGGIIDVTNTYLGIALKQGLVGLSLFLSFFILVLLGVYRAYRSVPSDEEEVRMIGRVLFSILISVLFIIATVSPISVIAITYWSIAAMGVAYIRMVEYMNRNHDVNKVIPRQSRGFNL